MSDSIEVPAHAARRQRKILVVDDDADATELVAGLLELQGHDVRAAHTPRKAIALAVEFQPDIAFLDIGLPMMDGFELVARLRSMRELRDCRFIAITGYDDADDRKRSKQVGFEAHLVKPICMDTLERAVLGASGNSNRAAV